MSSVSRLILILMFTLVCSTSALAQFFGSPEYREWEASGFVGGSFIGNFEFPTRVVGNVQDSFRTVGMHYASGYQIGVRVTQNLGDFGAASLEYNFANQPLRFTNLTPTVQSLSLSHNVNHFSYGFTYLPLNPFRRFRPYGAAGAGVALFYIPGKSRNEALELGVPLRDSWEFALNLGGGFKYLVDDQAALTFDIKDQISSVPSYGLPRSARVTNGQYIPGISRNGFLNNWQLNFGVAVQWDN